MMNFAPKFKVTRWTPTAAECYLNGCNCNTCYLSTILETKCVMKIVVLELVRKFGEPNLEEIIENYPKAFTK